MKIKFDVIAGDSQYVHHEYTIDWFNYDEVVKRLEDICDFYRLKGEERLGQFERARERGRERILEGQPEEVPPKKDFGPHPEPKVWEYDGAFKCTICKKSWGAIPDRPRMPKECA